MPYKKNKIEAQKTAHVATSIRGVAEVQSLMMGIPTPKILNGKIENLAEYQEQTVKTIREYLMLRYNLGSEVHEVAVGMFVDALKRWHLACNALDEHGDYQMLESGSFIMHPAHRVKVMAEKTMNTFFMDFGLLPRQSFSRAEASIAGGTESKETDVWTYMATNLNQQQKLELN